MLVAALAIAVQQAPATGAWEKLIAPGVTYRMEVAPGPMLINAVRITQEAEGVLMHGELGTGKVFDPVSGSKGRETVTATALRTNALVTVNADFFPFTGDPLGVMVRDGELISHPQNGRAAFCWGSGFVHAAYLTFSGGFIFEGKTVPIFGVNMECGDNMVVLNTPVAGYAVSREPASHAVFVFEQKLLPTGQWKPKMKALIENVTSVPIADGEIVLTFRGTPSEAMTFLSPGDEIDLRIDCRGTEWRYAAQAIGGGPFLVRDGKAFVPYAAEGFTEGFAKNRHPRTAIGKTKAGDVWIVTVDGRQTVSVGATLSELADVMLRLGCTDAINLDGGGSTTLNVASVTVNRPSEGAEREVANSILVFSSTVVPVSFPVGEQGPVVAGPAKIRVGASASYRVVDTTGEVVPQAEVLWSAQGAGWVDQSGVVTASSEGVCRLVALARGRAATLVVTVSKD